MIVVYSSLLISESINASDIMFSMLFNWLLASITMLLCLFFYFLLFSIVFFMIPVSKEKVKLKFALAIPTEAPIMPRKKIATPPVVADKAIKALSK